MGWGEERYWLTCWRGGSSSMLLWKSQLWWAVRQGEPSVRHQVTLLLCSAPARSRHTAPVQFQAPRFEEKHPRNLQRRSHNSQHHRAPPISWSLKGMRAVVAPRWAQNQWGHSHHRLVILRDTSLFPRSEAVTGTAAGRQWEERAGTLEISRAWALGSFENKIQKFK